MPVSEFQAGQLAVNGEPWLVNVPIKLVEFS